MSADPEGFARAYDDQVWTVYGFLAYRLGNRADAEDLTQQTFERALRAWGRFDPERGTLGAWLISIARNLLTDHYRRDRSASQRPLAEGELEAHAAEDPREAELEVGADLADALGRLGERERELIALRFGAELTGPEIAELTGLSLANVQQILSRSLRRLRRELDRYAASGPAPATPSAATASRQKPDPA